MASLLLTLSIWAATMCLSSIAVKCIDPLKAAHAHIDDDRYDMVEFGAAGQLRLDLSNQLRACGIASTDVIRLGSNNVLLKYRC